jgi:non-heme chloroperoxidase
MRLILSASAFVNAVPKLNSDRGPGMPAARKVQSHHGYRSCPIWSHSDDWAGRYGCQHGTMRIAMPFVTVGRENSAAIRIYYEDHGSGPPVVLVHGYAQNGRSWEKQEAVLLAAGHRVITYDRRGFGASSRPGTGYDFDTLAADLHVLLSRLRLRGVVLAGFAMGTGEVARYLAAHGSARVRAAVLVAPLLPFLLQTDDNHDGIDRSVFDGITARIAADRPAAMKDFMDESYNVDLLGGSRVSDQAWQNSFYTAICASAHAALRCVTACREDFRGDLATISVPVLVIHGDQDRILPYEATGRRLPALLKNARSVVIAGGPHAILWTHADEVNQALLGFIGNPGRAGRRHGGPENQPQGQSQNGRAG